MSAKIQNNQEIECCIIESKWQTVFAIIKNEKLTQSTK